MEENKVYLIKDMFPNSYRDLEPLIQFSSSTICVLYFKCFPHLFLFLTLKVCICVKIYLLQM